MDMRAGGQDETIVTPSTSFSEGYDNQKQQIPSVHIGRLYWRKASEQT